VYFFAGSRALILAEQDRLRNIAHGLPALPALALRGSVCLILSILQAPSRSLRVSNLPER
jgi:hypothetical protein